MTITVPIYVQAVDGEEDGSRTYRVRPLFFDGPSQRDEDLGRAMHRLVADLRKVLRGLGREDRHDALAAHAFCPELDAHRLDLTLELRRHRANCRFLFVTFEALGRRLAFTPSLPELWFEVGRGERLERRAAEVLTEHFRARERDDEEGFETPEALSIPGKAWVTTVAIEDVEVSRRRPVADDHRRAGLCGREVLEGQAELARVGRCLDRLYPDDLDCALGRDREVAELGRLLADGRPVLLLGPRLVGKTAIIHEWVYRAVAARPSPYAARENTWLLSPQRLISGMTFVGQWEDRLLAILKAAGKHRHILYFDDPLGLLHAGQTSGSKLCVAQVLRPYVERREVRVLAEMTPETYRVLRERDGGLADLFHVLPLAAPTGVENLRILLGILRRLEGRYRCRFGPEVLPAVLDLQRRYARDAEFPGKAAAFLGRLAVQFRGADVTRGDALRAFHAQSGLALTFLDDRARLDRREVLDALRREVVGQDEPLEAAADVLGIAKARLNDPGRPLASLLFLGPTGVGKTQCAKALASYLFGDPGRLLRFDLNEFVAPGSAARLVGTFDRPEGLLTAAVRRRPFAVLLLDEVEKAHPEVLDLLLQVLGEGRLTDALGRTVDFGNTLIVLTSNLGVRQAEGSLGFSRGDAGDSDAYRRAAEAFFRPEFFNRLDRIVPFRRLDREGVRAIAQRLIEEVFRRDGLMRRRCLLLVEDEALDRLVALGEEPALGARALKRAIERHLARPVAARLAGGIPEPRTVVRVLAGAGGLAIDVRGLADAGLAATPPDAAAAGDPRDRLRRLDAATRRIEGEFAGLRPGGAFDPARIDARQLGYFAVREQARRVRDLCRPIAERLERTNGHAPKPPLMPLGNLHRAEQDAKIRRQDRNSFPPWSNRLRERATAQDLLAYVCEAADGLPPPGDSPDGPLAEAIRQAALLQAMAAAAAAAVAAPVQALVYVRPLNRIDRPRAAWLAALYLRLFGPGLGVESEPVAGPEGGDPLALLVRGPHAPTLARVEEGTHLVGRAHQPPAPLQVLTAPLADEGEAAEALAALERSHRLWRTRLAEGRADPEDDPFPLRPVVRVYDEQGPTLDLRSGSSAPAPPSAETLRRFVLAALPVPEELS